MVCDNVFGRLPVTVLISLNALYDEQSDTFVKFKESKKHTQFKLSYVDEELPSDPKELFGSHI